MASPDRTVSRMIETLWTELGTGRPLPAVHLTGARGGLPSAYAVADFAAATVALASCALSDLVRMRSGVLSPSPAVTVDRRHAAVAFRSERYLALGDGPAASLWDPIAGDYRAADGWVRLHTNYAHHRAAALAALAVAEDRAAVTARVATLAAEEVEQLVVAAGGCAAKMRTAAEWAQHPQGRAVAGEPLVARELAPASADSWDERAERRRLDPRRAPLAGVRVLDLTRVIAGPVCTRMLAAYGADVLRIDPPGMNESAVLLGDVTPGKRCATLDLRSSPGRRKLEELAAAADLLVCGLRSGALARLGLDPARLRQLAPSLGQVYLDAYGWTGPWSGRRGFDSLVQMSAGIAARGQEALGTAAPSALPAQALDHGTGYLLAAVCCRALVDRRLTGRTTTARVSLARVAHLLASLGDAHDPRGSDLQPADAARYLEIESSPLASGPLRRVRVPGHVDGTTPGWSRPAGPLGVDPASFEDD